MFLLRGRWAMGKTNKQTKTPVKYAILSLYAQTLFKKFKLPSTTICLKLLFFPKSHPNRARILFYHICYNVHGNGNTADNSVEFIVKSPPRNTCDTWIHYNKLIWWCVFSDDVNIQGLHCMCQRSTYGWLPSVSTK